MPGVLTAFCDPRSYDALRRSGLGPAEAHLAVGLLEVPPDSSGQRR